MRICFLANGQFSHTYNWIQYFAKKGYEVHLISLDGYKYEPLANLTVHTINPVFPKNIKYLSFIINSWFGPFINSFKIKKLIRTIDPDILHAHYMTDYGLLGYLMHFPVFVLTLWGSDILVTPKKSLFHRIMAKYILDSAKLITCDSKFVCDESLKYCNDPEKTRIVLWGVDLTVFTPKMQYSRTLKNITILSTRGSSPIYNVDTIINTIPAVAKEFPDVRYIIKCIDFETDKLEREARLLKVTDFIDFNFTYFNSAEFSELHHKADIFISVPSSDSSSVSLHEAMASGLPVIVSDIPANHEWITHGWNGFIVPVRDPKELAKSILQLIENPDLMRLFGERNTQLIRDKADRKKHMAHMEELYHELLERK